MGKDRSVTALSLLNKREPSCVASFLTGLGKLFERGVDINLKVCTGTTAAASCEIM